MSFELKDKYIFLDEAEPIFLEKFDGFNKYFIDNLLMCGIADNGTLINDIDFDKSEMHENLFYDILIGGIYGIEPQIDCQYIKDNRLKVQCSFYNFGESDGINHIYMMINTMDYTSENDFACEVWSLIEPDIETINLYWSV